MLSSYAAETFETLEDVLREQTTGKMPMLHITDGESVAGTLRQSAVPGEVVIYGDLLYEGPAPAGVSNEQWRETRARFYADAGYANLEDARHVQRTWEQALEKCWKHDEVVLWTDHRLSDQLILIRVLDYLGSKGLENRISLICAGHYPGIENFIGLGQLNEHQLASLADTRLRITQAHLATARKAWNAFCSPDPTAIESVLESDPSPLPFLAPALHRQLQQFPSVQNGLPRTEHQALAILNEHGPMSAIRLFFAVQRSEELLFMGDTSFYRLLIGLASGANPVIEIAGTRDLQFGDRNSVFEQWTNSPVSITKTGSRVLHGDEDYIVLNGINHWVGGVHLEGREAAWRWDRDSSRLVNLRRNKS
jgi:hypothetical protein